MSIDTRSPRRDEKGVALITTLMVVLAVGALITGAVAIGANHILVDRYWSRSSNLGSLADGGLEKGMAIINADRSKYPVEGYEVLEAGAELSDVNGEPISGVKRWVYAGPSGITSGQYGVFGSIVSVTKDDGGGISVRRQQLFQESFAKYAYFTDNEGGNIYFASGDQIWGPLHTNDQIKIHSSGATFWDEVTTAEDVYQPQYGSFMEGYIEYQPSIPLPETADLVKLQTQAQSGGTAFAGTSLGADGEATTRIEFVALDLNNDGDTQDEDEGFIRVYQSDNPQWVSAKGQPVQSCVWNRRRRRWDCTTVNSLVGTWNCGDLVGGVFSPSAAQPDAADSLLVVTQPTSRCFLGGDDQIWNGAFDAGPDPMGGTWLQWTGTIDSRITTVAGRQDAAYLFPINRPLNPSFKGVIYIDGNVLVSGVIRGRVTIAATGNIVLGDDITYATNPGSGLCEDVAGYFAGESFVLSNNAINAGTRAAAGEPFRNYDNSNGEFIHGVVLALQKFTAEEYNQGSTSAQSCGTQNSGRGCIFLIGGIIQDTRGAVGLTSGTGYIKRYSYDQCARSNPPPYFPTTGQFVKGQYYEVDPAGFSIDDFFGDLAHGG